MRRKVIVSIKKLDDEMCYEQKRVNRHMPCPMCYEQKRIDRHMPYPDEGEKRGLLYYMELVKVKRMIPSAFNAQCLSQ